MYSEEKNIIKLLLFPLNKIRKISIFLVEHGCPPIWAKHVIKGIFWDNFNRNKGQVPFVPLEVSLFLHSSTYNNHCFCRWSIYAFRKLSSQYIQFCQLSMSWVHFWWISVQANLLSIDFNVSWPKSKGFSTSCSYQSWSNFNDATSNNSSTFKTTCSYFIRFNQLIRWF